MKCACESHSAEPPREHFASSARGRKELVAAGALCASFLVVPLLLAVFGGAKLYPLSAGTMFSSRAVLSCGYEILDPDGERLSGQQFGLPQLGTSTNQGRRSISQQWLSDQRSFVTAQVQRQLAQSKEPRFVYVVQRLIGPEEGGRVGFVGARVWTVTNPRYGDSGRTASRKQQRRTR